MPTSRIPHGEYQSRVASEGWSPEAEIERWEACGPYLAADHLLQRAQSNSNARRCRCGFWSHKRPAQLCTSRDEHKRSRSRKVRLHIRVLFQRGYTPVPGASLDSQERSLG